MPKKTANGQKSSKALDRSAREKAHNASVRTSKIMRSRNNHIKNALRSCGEAFAKQLRVHYAEVGYNFKKH